MNQGYMPQFYPPPFYPSTPAKNNNASIASLSFMFLILILVAIGVGVYFYTKKDTATTTTTTTDSNSSSTTPTTRQQLEAVCPKDNAAGDKINFGNSAKREDYLFSACKVAGSCDSPILDPISETLLGSLKTKANHCGAWEHTFNGKKIEWDVANNKWALKKTVREQLDELCPKNVANGDKINAGNLATRDEFLFSACKESGTCDTFTPDARSQILIDSLSSKNGTCGGWNQPEKAPKMIWNNALKKWEVVIAPVLNTSWVVPNNLTIKGGKNKQFCADDNAMICDRASVGPWEKFKFTPISSNTATITGGQRNMYCSDRNGVADNGSAPEGVVCNVSNLGGWETFTYNVIDTNKITLKSGHTGKYCSDTGTGKGIVCKSDTVGENEIFTVSQS